ISCDSSDDNHVHQENKLEKFKGTWTGTYSGDGENGTWTATFDSAGNATGKLVSGSSSFDLVAQVDAEGEINAEYTSGTTKVGTMEGTMTATTGNGTWESELLDIKGTWTGTKN
ncbi:MAG: hypothetical protein RSF68_14640, partial [Myroides sp.]